MLAAITVTDESIQSGVAGQQLSHCGTPLQHSVHQRQAALLCTEPVVLKLLLAINAALAAVLYSSDYQIAVFESSVLSVGHQSDYRRKAYPVAGTVISESSDTTQLL